MCLACYIKTNTIFEPELRIHLQVQTKKPEYHVMLKTESSKRKYAIKTQKLATNNKLQTFQPVPKHAFKNPRIITSQEV